MNDSIIDLKNYDEIKKFLNEITFSDIKHNEIKTSLALITQTPFNNDSSILDLLQNYFYFKRDDVGLEECLIYFKNIFDANNYSTNFLTFFDKYGYENFKNIDHQIIIWDYINKYLLTGEMNNFFFGMWLYEKLFDIGLFMNKYQPDKINIVGLKLILQGVLYYSFNAENICLFALKLSNLIPDDIDAELFYNVCINEVYENYPQTFINTIKSYNEKKNAYTDYLIDSIRELHNRFIELQKEAKNIPDLQPSAERFVAYQKAYKSHQQIINDEMESQSVFNLVATKRVLKYGKRNAFIQVGANNSKIFKVSDYMYFSSESELPNVIIKDPVEVFFSKKEYIKERKNYCASCN